MSVHAESAERTGRSGARKADRGEDRAAAIAGLDLLRAVGWLVLHDVAVPGDVEVPIDHVLAGPSGVYVINTISGSGAIRMDDTSLLVGGVSQFAHVEDVAAAALALREAIGGRPVVPILCFQRPDEVAGVVAKVAVCSTENILELLNGQPKMLDAVAANDLMRSLNATLERQSAARRTLTAAETPAEIKPRHREKARGRKRLLGFGRSVDEAPVELSVVPPLPEPSAEVDRVAEDEAERLAAEEAARVEAERLAAEKAARLEAERVAAEEAARLEAERLAAEEAARLEAERLAAEEAARVEAERLAAEEAARVEAERLAAEEAARVEAERLAAEEAARLEAERLEAERLAAEEAERLEAERLEAERLAAEEAARVEAERLAAEEAARVEAERVAAEEAARLEAERLAAGEVARLEAERLEAERLAAEETARLEAERIAAEEDARFEAECAAAEEAARAEVRRRRAEVEARREAARLQAEAEAEAEAEASEPVVQGPRVVPQARRVDSTDSVAPPVGPAAKRVDVRSAVKMVSAAFARRDDEPDFSLADLEATYRSDEPEARALPAWFGGAAPSAAAAPAPQEATPGRPMRRSLMPAVVAAAVVALIFAVVPRVPDAYAWGRSFFVEPPPPAFGESMVLGETPSHPAIRMVAGVPLSVKPANGAAAGKGRHWVGVPVQATISGDAKWTLPISRAVRAVDNLGVPLAPSSRVGKVTNGKVLPRRLTLVPGRTVVGMVVFAVQNGRQIGTVKVTLSSADAAAVWKAADPAS